MLFQKRGQNKVLNYSGRRKRSLTKWNADEKNRKDSYQGKNPVTKFHPFNDTESKRERNLLSLSTTKSH